MTDKTPPARPRPGHLELAQHRVRRATAASSRWRSASSARSIPQPGWVEHDPQRDLGSAARDRARGARARPGSAPRDIAAHRHHQPARDHAGVEPRAPAQPIAQRDRLAGPAHRADLRARCASAASSRLFRAKTGLVIDAYFSGTKLQWLLDHVPGARAAAARGELAFGTVDTLAAVAARPAAARCTPPTSSNASRTMLFDVRAQRLGRRAARGCSTSRARCCRRCTRRAMCYGDDRRRPARRADPDRRHRRRPAERAVRPGLLQGRAWRRTPTAPAASC